jgi:hypothetical protein
VSFASFQQNYALKTDDELLLLSSDRGSLVAEARRALEEELRRRDLQEGSPAVGGEGVGTNSFPSTSHSVHVLRARWFGLWFLNTLIATNGVAITTGFCTYSSAPFVSRAVRFSLVNTPPYPFPTFVGLVVGYFSYTRFRGSYRYWAWILPAVLTLWSLSNWKASNRSTWSASMAYFFGFVPFTQNHRQISIVLFLYMSVAYSLGAMAQALVQNKLSRAK